MHLHFVDINRRVVEALRESFGAYSEVSVEHGDLLAVAHYAIVSPANSHGIMDGGIDRDYSQFFTPKLVTAVREAVLARPEGYLPVGAAIRISTGNNRIPHLIVAPTMYMPESVPASNAYRALRAVLRLVNLDPLLDGDI